MMSHASVTWRHLFFPQHGGGEFETMPAFRRDIIEKLTKQKKDALHFDESSPGFFLRTYKSGAPAVFGVKYSVGGKQRRMNLGPATPSNWQTMRDLAVTVRAKAKLGQDTLGEQKEERARPKAPTFAKLVPTYLKAREEGRDGETKLRARSLYVTGLYLNLHWKALHGHPIDAINRDDIEPLIDDMAEIRGKTTADRARTVLSTFFSWAIGKRYIATNPTINIKDRASGGSRERVLSEEEIVGVWNAASNAHDFGKVVRLLLLTGCRKMEIVGLVWSEIDFDKRQIELPGERTKNKRAHVIQLSDQALAILKSCHAIAGQEQLFASFSVSRYKDDLDARLPANMPHWTLHDLRRTFVTHMAENGFTHPHIIEACVNHTGPAKAAIAGVYNKATYGNEKRQAFDLWGQFIEDLVAGRRSKVTALRKGAA
jgi:integrase